MLPSTLQISLAPPYWMQPQTIILPPPNLTVFWVNRGSRPWGSSTILVAFGMELNWWFIWNFFWHFSAVQPSIRLWALAYTMRFLSSLLFSAGFRAAIRLWRPMRARIRHTVLDETGVAGVHSSLLCYSLIPKWNTFIFSLKILNTTPHNYNMKKFFLNVCKFIWLK